VPLDDRIMLMIDFEKIVAEINPEIGMQLKADKEIIKENEENAGKKLDTDIKKIAVIAEDSGLIRDMMKDILSRGGYEVVPHNNGKAAWEFIESKKKKAKEENNPITNYIHVVVSDIEMPQMDGHSLTKNIKNDPDLKVLPVILFSSLIYEEIRKKGEQIGADAQISKPEIGNLLNIIKDLTSKQKQQ
jgi:two-component system chemotaxis response regulator CheV